MAEVRVLVRVFLGFCLVRSPSLWKLGIEACSDRSKHFLGLGLGLGLGFWFGLGTGFWLGLGLGFWLGLGLGFWLGFFYGFLVRSPCLWKLRIEALMAEVGAAAMEAPA
jgi:hypothetical protein